MHCDRANVNEDRSYEFETKSWGPPNLILQEIAKRLKDQVILSKNYLYVYKLKILVCF